MCTPYKIEAFADNSRPGSEVGEDERELNRTVKDGYERKSSASSLILCG